MSKSDYLENKVLDHVLGGGDFARPATVYVGYFIAAPTDAGGGTEPAGGSYARAAVTNNSTNFPAAVGGVKSNGTVINFAQATSAQGTAVAVGVWDALSGGNLLFWAMLTTPKTIQSGDTPNFSIGALQFTES